MLGKNKKKKEQQSNREVNTTFKRGATMAGVHNKNRSLELERLTARKKIKRQKIIVAIGVFLVLGFLGFYGIATIVKTIDEHNRIKLIAKNERELTPTIDILDENKGGVVSDRVKKFVVLVERDLNDLGLIVDRAILPFRMTKEVDLYLKDEEAYYKLSIDRGSAEQAEDITRIKRYLEKREITVEYIDLRVEGKAFYK